jgi:intracellular sulfur oxidation DsrE/DsrF family protein
MMAPSQLELAFFKKKNKYNKRLGVETGLAQTCVDFCRCGLSVALQRVDLDASR